MRSPKKHGKLTEMQMGTLVTSIWEYGDLLSLKWEAIHKHVRHAFVQREWPYNIMLLPSRVARRCYECSSSPFPSKVLAEGPPAHRRDHYRHVLHIAIFFEPRDGFGHTSSSTACAIAVGAFYSDRIRRCPQPFVRQSCFNLGLASFGAAALLEYGGVHSPLYDSSTRASRTCAICFRSD